MASRRLCGLVRGLEGGAVSDRTFFVRLNLDDMAAEVVGLETSEERGQWLDGFLVGSRGKDPRESWSGQKMDGHRFGLQCYYEAETFREKKSAAGEASAQARKNRFGSAQPNATRTPLEQCSNAARTDSEQTTEQAPNQPTSNNQHPVATSQKRSAKSFDSSSAESIYQLYPRKEGKGKALPAIEKALRTTTAEVLTEAVKAFAAAKAGTDPQYIPHPASWFNARRWEDDRASWLVRPAGAFTGAISQPITVRPGDLDGIPQEAIDRL